MLEMPYVLFCILGNSQYFFRNISSSITLSNIYKILQLNI